MTIFHFVLLISVVFIWGFNFVAIKASLYEIPPIFLCFCRFLFSTFPLIFFIKRPPASFKKIAIYSSVMFVLQFSLLFTAMRSGITPALASVLLQSQSFFAIGFAVFFVGEKFQLWQAAGAFVAFLGILLVGTHTGSEITLTGLFLVLSAAVMWATGSILAKKMDKASGLPLVVWSSLIACPPLLGLSLLLEGADQISESIQKLSWSHLGWISYIAYLSTLFGFGIWNRLLQYYPVSKLAPFTLLVPIVGIFSSSAVLGEPLQWWKIAAAALILTGLCIHLFGSKIWEAVADETPS